VIDGGVPRNRRSGFPRPPLLLINTHLKPPPNDLHHRTLPAATARSHLPTQPTLHTTVPFLVSNPAFVTPQSVCRTPMCAPSDPTQSARQPSSPAASTISKASLAMFPDPNIFVANVASAVKRVWRSAADRAAQATPPFPTATTSSPAQAIGTATSAVF
jgi:hypothetical protein